MKTTRYFLALLVLAVAIFAGSAAKADAAYWTWSGFLTQNVRTPSHHYYRIKISWQSLGGCAFAENWRDSGIETAGVGTCNWDGSVVAFSYDVNSVYSSYFNVYCHQVCWAPPQIGITAWYNP